MTSLLTSNSAPQTPSGMLATSRDLPSLPTPRAVLLDFGGVIFETSKHADGRDRLAARWQELLAGVEMDYSIAQLRHSIDAGLTALKAWKNASSRRLKPLELTHRQVMTDFMASELPAGAREFLACQAQELLVQQNRLISGHSLRPGIQEFIATCRQRNIPLGVVSNAHAGASHRQLLEEHGLGDAFAVQIYSDEVGIRKPHPRMLTLAADALDVDISSCWYVGDTQDRDVVAGRRAGVGAVILTRCHHTDAPPFAVRDRADVVLDTPQGMVDLLALATPDDATASTGDETTTTHEAEHADPTLLIDHGGVISTSVDDPAARQDFIAELAQLIAPVAADADPTELATHILADVIAGHQHRKQQRRDQGDHTEVSPAEFWTLNSAHGYSPAVAARLLSEAPTLMKKWGLAKSRRTLREGIPELLSWCADHGVKVVVVTNTISGSAVRSQLAHHGIAQYITAVVASDEFGVRKPHPAIMEAALDIAGADPRSTFFLGDKPSTDGLGALAANIAHRVLVRGGSTDETTLKTALDQHLATELIDQPGDLLPLIQRVTGH